MVSDIHTSKTKGVSEILKTTSKTRHKRSARFFRTTSKTRHKRSLRLFQTSYFKKKQGMSHRGSLRFFQTTAKTRHKGYLIFSQSSYFKNQIQEALEILSKLLQKQKSPRSSLKLSTSKTRYKRTPIFILQKQKEYPRFLKLLQELGINTKGFPEILSNYFKNKNGSSSRDSFKLLRNQYTEKSPIFFFG